MMENKECICCHTIKPDKSYITNTDTNDAICVDCVCQCVNTVFKHHNIQSFSELKNEIKEIQTWYYKWFLIFLFIILICFITYVKN